MTKTKVFPPKGAYEACHEGISRIHHVLDDATRTVTQLFTVNGETTVAVPQAVLMSAEWKEGTRENGLLDGSS